MVVRCYRAAVQLRTIAMPMEPFEPLRLGEPIAPQILKSLRARIVRGDLVPGTRISEAEIAERHKVSRQPVREAFIRLAEESLVEVRPQRGTFVRKISMEAVMGARFVREAVEADIVKLLATLRPVGALDELRRLVAAQSEVAGDPVKFLALDEAFHRTLAAAARQQLAWRTVEAIKVQTDRVRHLSAVHVPVATLISQHGAIVDAITRGDVAGAEGAMRRHLREIMKDLPVIAGAHPDCFDADMPGLMAYRAAGSQSAGTGS